MKKLFAILTVSTLSFMFGAFGQRTVIQDIPVSITTQPRATAGVCELTGQIIIDLEIAGTNPTFQWQEFNPTWTNLANSSIVSGVTNDSLILTAPPLSYNGRQFRVIVSGGGACNNSVTSNAVAVTVDANPLITTHPTSATACEGNSANFSITATGTGLSYQWQENGVNLSDGGVYSGATTPSLTISNVTGLNGKTYRCVVSGTCGTPVTSNSATLTVNTSPVIAVQPVAPAGTCNGTGTQTMSVTATGTGLTYQWQVNTGSGWNNVVNNTTYSGATTPSLTITNPTSAMNGYQYQVVVSGTCAPSITSNTVAITVHPNAVVTVPPTPQSVCAAGSIQNNVATFTLTNNDATYQWQYNSGSGWYNATGGVFSNETTSSLLVTNPPLNMNGTQFRCKLTTIANGCVSYTTPVSLTVNPLPTNPTWLVAGSTADTAHYCTGGVTMTLNPTQIGTTYELQYWPAGVPAAVANNPTTGNGGTRTWTGVTAGSYQIQMTTSAGCRVIKLD